MTITAFGNTFEIGEEFEIFNTASDLDGMGCTLVGISTHDAYLVILELEKPTRNIHYDVMVKYITLPVVCLRKKSNGYGYDEF
jgi:hypothetical protein